MNETGLCSGIPTFMTSVAAKANLIAGAICMYETMHDVALPTPSVTLANGVVVYRANGDDVWVEVALPGSPKEVFTEDAIIVFLSKLNSL